MDSPSSDGGASVLVDTSKESVYEFPADTPGETEAVPYYVDRVFREDWERRRER